MYLRLSMLMQILIVIVSAKNLCVNFKKLRLILFCLKIRILSLKLFIESWKGEKNENKDQAKNIFL